MQKKLESFFKPCLNSNNLFDETISQNPPDIRIKYTRREKGLIEEEKVIKKKKRRSSSSYAQYHLELGQSDFLLHSCKICGVKYAKGDQIDEKVHSSFHNNFTLGIPFKGWRHERVIDLPLLGKDRVILLLSSDPSAQRNKVQEVVKMMEIELGEGWIFDELCRVYLFISMQRIAGCVVVEPINAAFKIISNSEEKTSKETCVKEVKLKPTTLQFGKICFKREVSKKCGSLKQLETLDSNTLGSIICEKDSVPASCGIRAIWVTPSNRRKHIATHLLNAVRKSFCTDQILEPSQLAFSAPTSTGQALASKFTATKSFLVYRS